MTVIISTPMGVMQVNYVLVNSNDWHGKSAKSVVIAATVII